jgi:hypothetical protein
LKTSWGTQAAFFYSRAWEGKGFPDFAKSATAKDDAAMRVDRDRALEPGSDSSFESENAEVT